MSNITLEQCEKRKEKIGHRIREERKKLNLTQDEFKDKIFISSRQTVARWESGKVLPSMSDFLCMCCLFNCEIGYLLCEYDCKTRAATDVKSETGLSERAVYELQQANKQRMYFVLLALNELLQDEGLYTLDIIGQYFALDEAQTIAKSNGQIIKEKTLAAFDVQQSIADIRHKVQERLNEV